jgi:hypothetical protein
MRERWGEGLTGTVAINAAFGLVGGVLGGLIGVGAGLSGGSSVTGYTLVVIGFVGLMLVATAANAVRQVFAVALYRYATTGEASGGFPERDLERPTRPKRKRKLFRRSPGR